MDAHVIQILKEKLEKLLNNPENENEVFIDNEHEDTGKAPSEMFGEENNDAVIY